MSKKPDEINNECTDKGNIEDLQKDVNLESTLSEPKAVTVDGTWIVEIPEGYKYCTDRNIIGEYRNIIIMEDTQENSFQDPFNASVSFTSMYTEIDTMPAPNMAKLMVKDIDETKVTVLKDEKDLYLAYYFDCSHDIDGEKMDVFIIQIGCGNGLSTVQVCFNDNKAAYGEQCQFVNSVADTIRLSPKTNTVQLISSDNTVRLSPSIYKAIENDFPNTENGKSYSRISMVCGIVAIVSFLGELLPSSSDNIAFILLISSIVMSLMAIMFARISKKKGSKKSMRTVGFVLGLVTIVLWIVVFSVGVLTTFGYLRW